MAKYPGFSILYEVGSRKELAQSYGVSERTIYRWLNKAAKESGLSQELTLTKYPGSKKLKSFKGTRAQLAAKYNVSERTIYRWLNKARSQGAAIPSRQPQSKYPGWQFADEPGTLKDLAERYNVSTRTISRWKQKAKKDKFPEEIITEEPFDETKWKTTQEEITSPDEPLSEMPEEVIIEEPEEPLSELPEEVITEDISDDTLKTISSIIDIISGNEALLSPNSIFGDLDREMQIEYIDAYLQYQYDMDEHQFYDPESHTMSFDPEFVTNINIWGEEFNDWVSRQFASELPIEI